MDILSEESYRVADGLSRYSSFPYYYNSNDDKYVSGIPSQLSKSTSYVLHKVVSGDTLESLAFKYYGRPDYYWVIGMFNDVNDSYAKLSEKYSTLKVPAVSAIKFEG
jgi:nucleoid-associated protein YgaU